MIFLNIQKEKLLNEKLLNESIHFYFNFFSRISNPRRWSHSKSNNRLREKSNSRHDCKYYFTSVKISFMIVRIIFNDSNNLFCDCKNRFTTVKLTFKTIKHFISVKVIFMTVRIIAYDCKNDFFDQWNTLVVERISFFVLKIDLLWKQWYFRSFKPTFEIWGKNYAKIYRSTTGKCSLLVKWLFNLLF